MGSHDCRLVPRSCKQLPLYATWPRSTAWEGTLTQKLPLSIAAARPAEQTEGLRLANIILKFHPMSLLQVSAWRTILARLGISSSGPHKGARIATSTAQAGANDSQPSRTITVKPSSDSLSCNLRRKCACMIWNSTSASPRHRTGTSVLNNARAGTSSEPRDAHHHHHHHHHHDHHHHHHPDILSKRIRGTCTLERTWPIGGRLEFCTFSLLPVRPAFVSSGATKTAVRCLPPKPYHVTWCNGRPVCTFDYGCMMLTFCGRRRVDFTMNPDDGDDIEVTYGAFLISHARCPAIWQAQGCKVAHIPGGLVYGRLGRE